MIGKLPRKLNINGTDWAIRTDYRVALLIFQAYNDSEMSDPEKTMALLECLYEEFDNIPSEDYKQASDQALWFLDGGSNIDENSNHQQAKKLMDWEQDEQLIFSAVNKVAGRETRDVEYLHWWTFLGYMRETGECLFNTVVSIREKVNKNKRLEKHESDFYQENKSLIDLKKKLPPDEQERQDKINELLR